MTEKKNKAINRAFSLLMSAVLLFVVAVFCSALYKHCTAYTAPESEQGYNVDSIRRAHRAITDSIREAQCVTLEDSIHHFEDGY